MKRTWRYIPRLTASLAGTFLLLLTACTDSSAPILEGDLEAASRSIELQLLAVSDWHAQLDPLSGVGGAAEISAYWQADRLANPNTLTLTAGDAYGASPPLAGFFNEKPAVKAMNLMGFDVDTLGNHNFDRGTAHLQEMIDLADFQYVSANLSNLEANLTGIKPFEIFEVGGVKVAVIGITNPEAPTLVAPGSFGTLEVTDPVPAALKALAAAKRAGAQVFVAITHLGVSGFDSTTGEPFGPLIDFANNVGGFDVIFGDHTDVQFSTTINNALIVENRSKGQTYSKVKLSFDTKARRVNGCSVEFVVPLSNMVTPDPAVVTMLAPYRTALAALFDGVIGTATAVFPRGGAERIERVREVAIGNLITDALRWRYGTQLALYNGGSIRSALPSSYLPADTTLRRTSGGYAAGPPYDLVIGDVFSVLPFGNEVVTRTVTGSQLYAILEHSVAEIPAANGRFGQISGFRFTYDSSRAAGSRVTSVVLDGGTPILPDTTTYTFATNNFINDGGDGYTMLADGQGVTREQDADVVLEYIRHLGAVTPVVEGRITNSATP